MAKPKKTLYERTQEADFRAGMYLGNYNELVESGYPEDGPKAQKLFAQCQFWLDRYNLLTSQANNRAPKQ
jgi:hypothetical protein